MVIRQATIHDVAALAGLALRLWPHHTLEELTEDFSTLLSQRECACFLLMDADLPVGFAQCQLRRDYVEGTDSSPVGYLEAVYVSAPYRRQGHARSLVRTCEAWAQSLGCVEFASDCELENDVSQAFHLGIGFREANRIICFTKVL